MTTTRTFTGTITLERRDCKACAGEGFHEEMLPIQSLADWAFPAGTETLLTQTQARDDYEYFDLPAGLTSADGSRLAGAVRVKKVLFRLPSALRPAWYVEVFVQDGAPQVLIVSVDGLNFREQPDGQSKAIRGLSKGERVTLVATQGDWYKVEDSKGVIGYITSNPTYTEKPK